MTERKRGDQHPLIHRLPIKKDGKTVAFKEVASFRGLLHKAHGAGLTQIETKLVQLPNRDNGMTAIVQATVQISKGRFTGIGDANPKNVNPRVAPHATRMAETRAIARAFRVALDIGVVALEELEADLDEGLAYEGAILPAHAGRSSNGAASGSSRTHQGNGSSSNGDSARSNGGHPSNGYESGRASDDARATEKQRKFLFRLVHDAGYSGDEARKLLHTELDVSSVKDATRASVSALIDRLKNGEFNRGNGHAASQQ